MRKEISKITDRTWCFCDVASCSGARPSFVSFVPHNRLRRRMRKKDARISDASSETVSVNYVSVRGFDALQLKVQSHRF